RVTPVPVTTVTVAPASASVLVGQLLQLSATTADSAGNVLSGRTVTWASSNSLVATVTSTGLLTGLATGTTTITATSEGARGTAAVAVTVAPVATVTVSPGAPGVAIGGTAQLTAVLRDANGNPLSGRTVSWATTDGGVATVSAQRCRSRRRPRTRAGRRSAGGASAGRRTTPAWPRSRRAGS